MSSGTPADRKDADPIKALLAEWLGRVICASRAPTDVDSSESYATATDDAMHARLDADRIAGVQIARLYDRLARRAAEWDAIRALRATRIARRR
jgi:hypothetical protein